MSAKGFYLVQDGHFVDLIKPVSAGAAQTSTRFNMAMWNHASLIVRFGAAGGPTGAIVLKVYSAFTGGSGVAIPYRYFLQNAGSAPFDVFGSIQQATSAGYTPSSDAADADLVIELDADELSAAANGTYVELDIAAGSLGTTAQLLDAFGVLSGGRFACDQSVTVQQ
jgi:hypothetical protein